MLIEWPKDQAEHCEYILSTLAENTLIANLASATYQLWRIEHNYQDLQQNFGLSYYTGRGWRSFRPAPA